MILLYVNIKFQTGKNNRISNNAQVREKMNTSYRPGPIPFRPDLDRRPPKIRQYSEAQATNSSGNNKVRDPSGLYDQGSNQIL